MTMMKQQDSSAAAAVAAAFTPASCGQCGIDARPFLHHIRHRGMFRRLCTTCVLRVNSKSFCPTCFQIHDARAAALSFQSPETVNCSKCYSNSHSSCVGPNPNTPYICPLCTNQFSPIFNWNDNEIDKKSAAALLAAATIATDSMNKAADAACAEAEKRSKEAALSRKRAKESIEHVASIEEKLEKESAGLNEMPGFGRMMGNVGERNLFGDGIRMDRVDNSSAVLAALNAVELREKEKQQNGVRGNGLLSGGLVPMDVRENGWSNGNGVEKGADGLVMQFIPAVDANPIAVVEQPAQNNHPKEANGGPFH